MRTFAGVMKDAEMFVVRGSPPPVRAECRPRRVRRHKRTRRQFAGPHIRPL